METAHGALTDATITRTWKKSHGCHCQNRIITAKGRTTTMRPTISNHVRSTTCPMLSGLPMTLHVPHLHRIYWAVHLNHVAVTDSTAQIRTLGGPYGGLPPESLRLVAILSPPMDSIAQGVNGQDITVQQCNITHCKSNETLYFQGCFSLPVIDIPQILL